MEESAGSSKVMLEQHDDTTSLLNGIKLLEENCASCINEQEFEKIFEPFLSLQPDLSRSKIYNFFNERMKKANISKNMNIEDLNEMFTKKANLMENCKPYEKSVAWRPSGNVKTDLNIRYNVEQKKYQEKLEKEIHRTKLELDKLLDEIKFKINKIDRNKSELPELHMAVDEIHSNNENTKKLLLNTMDFDQELDNL